MADETPIPLNPGYACSSGQKLSMPGQKYTTQEDLTFDSWFRQDSSVRRTKMLTMLQHFLPARTRYTFERPQCLYHWMINTESKVGEPGFPVAAAERGQRVLLSHNATFEVGDHDFTRMSIVPSIRFIIDIPELVESSWYNGKVCVGLKEAIF